jgi:Protein of unknown function (DUF3987)
MRAKILTGGRAPTFDQAKAEFSANWTAYATDPTIERLAALLQTRPRGMMLIRDKLRGLFANMGRYSKGSDRPFWLESWNGGRHVVERVSGSAVPAGRAAALQQLIGPLLTKLFQAGVLLRKPAGVDAQCVPERSAIVQTIRACARSDAGILGPQGISDSVLERHRFIPGRSCIARAMIEGRPKGGRPSPYDRRSSRRLRRTTLGRFAPPAAERGPEDLFNAAPSWGPAREC